MLEEEKAKSLSCEFEDKVKTSSYTGEGVTKVLQ